MEGSAVIDGPGSLVTDEIAGNVTIRSGTVTANQIKGALSTGSSGNAFINANSISDNSNESSWSGIIFKWQYR